MCYKAEREKLKNRGREQWATRQTGRNLKILVVSQRERERKRNEIAMWHRPKKEKIEKQGLGTGKREPDGEKSCSRAEREE